jgi:hypothetical protein
MVAGRRNDPLIPLQHARYPADCASKLVGVTLADPFHGRLPYRLILEIDEGERLIIVVHYDVALGVFLNPPGRGVAFALGHFGM